MQDEDRTASLMTPAKLAQVRPKVPVSPSAWLDKMAADAGHQHVRRIGELREDLQAQAQRRDFSPLAADLARLAETLPRLDFGLLQSRGLLARLSGKSKSAGAEFAAQFDQIDQAASALAEQAKALQGTQGEQANRTDIALLELEVEFRALDKIIDQGARWLQDMRNQLKTREAEGGDEASRAQVREDSTRCELLVERLKMLRAVTSAAQRAHEQAQAAATRRAGLVQALQQPVSAQLKAWRARIPDLAAGARDGKSPTEDLESSMDCHRDLQLCVKRTLADCGQLQAHEMALAEALDELGGHLASS
jgi:hypothetical protein